MGKLAGVILLVAGCNGGGVDITGKSADLAVVPDLASPGPLSIAKSGPPYTGSHTDPGLNSPSDCPDQILEPNDSADTALVFMPTPDDPHAPKIIKVAICPLGDNPGTGRHDQDWFKVDLTTGPPGLTLMAQVIYDITLGDLDVAIVDAAGNIVAADGTAVANGCAVTPVQNGVYYVVVTGANNVDVNNYEALIRTFTTAHACP